MIIIINKIFKTDNNTAKIFKNNVILDTLIIELTHRNSRGSNSNNLQSDNRVARCKSPTHSKVKVYGNATAMKNKW